MPAPPLARWAYRLTATLVGTTLAAAAAGTAAVWISLGNRDDLGEAGSQAVNAILRIGGTAVIAGIGLIVFLFALRKWPSVAETGPDWQRQIGGWLRGLTGYLALLPFLLCASALPAIQLTRSRLPLTDNPLAQFELMIPLFETVTTLGLVLGAVTLIWLLQSRSQLFPRAFLALAWVHAGFVLMTFAAIDLNSAITALASAVPSIAEHDAGVRAVAWYQTWLLIATVAWIPLVVLSPRTATTFGERSVVKPARHPIPGQPADPRAANQFAPSLIVPPQSASAEDAAKYFVRANYFAGFLGGSLSAIDLNATRTLPVTLAPFTGHIRIASPDSAADIAKAERDRYLTPHPSYVVTGPMSQPLGVVKKISHDAWRILGTAGEDIGAIDLTKASMGRAEYEARLGDDVVCTYAWSNVLRPELALDCAPDIRRVFDWRLALVCGLAIYVDVTPT
jgi:hypothetical protein